MRNKALIVLIALVISTMACNAVSPTPTLIPPTATPVPPTETFTAIPPTPTPIPPTATPVPPTATQVPPTATPIPPTATALPTATAETGKQIKIILDEGKGPVPGQTIWLAYYDAAASQWVTLNVVTGQDGMATFKIPEEAGGASATFVFGFSESEVNGFASDIKGGRRLGFRIPADPSQKSLTIKTDKKFNATIVDGSVQLWTPK